MPNRRVTRSEQEEASRRLRAHWRRLVAPREPHPWRRRIIVGVVATMVVIIVVALWNSRVAAETISSLLERWLSA